MAEQYNFGVVSPFSGNLDGYRNLNVLVKDDLTVYMLEDAYKLNSVYAPINSSYLLNNCYRECNIVEVLNQSDFFKYSTNTSRAFADDYKFTGSIMGAPRSTNTSYMYYNCSNLKGSSTNSNVTLNSAYMYYNCRKLTGTPSYFENSVNTSYMYCNCYNLTGTPIIGTKTTNAACMYYQCNRLTGVPKVTSLSNNISLYKAFDGCNNLSGTWDMRSNYYNNIGNFRYMFMNRRPSSWLTMNINNGWLYSRFANNNVYPFDSPSRNWGGSGFNLMDSNTKIRMISDYNWMLYSRIGPPAPSANSNKTLMKRTRAMYGNYPNINSAIYTILGSSFIVNNAPTSFGLTRMFNSSTVTERHSESYYLDLRLNNGADLSWAMQPGVMELYISGKGIESGAKFNKNYNATSCTIYYSYYRWRYDESELNTIATITFKPWAF